MPSRRDHRFDPFDRVEPDQHRAVVEHQQPLGVAETRGGPLTGISRLSR